MSDTTPLAPASAPNAVSVPVPSTAPPPTTETPAKPEAAASQEPPAESKEGTQDEQPRGDDGKFKPKKTAEDRKAQIRSEIDTLTATKRATEREVERLRNEAIRLNEQLRQSPQEDPYDTVSATRRAVKEERLQQTIEQAQAAVQQVNQHRVATFEAKLEAARERIPDLDQALNDFSRLPVTEVAADLIAESDKAAEIAYYLAKNPQDAFRISRLPVHLQGAEIARIENRVSAAPTVRKSSNAPPPVPMINGSSSPSSKTPAEMSVEEMGKLIYGR